MGFWNKKSEGPEVGEIVDALRDAKNAKERQKIIQDVQRGKHDLSAKDLKRIRDFERRVTEGERGLGAIGAALKGGGSKNYQNIPLRERVHPSEYKRILDKEARKQGLL